jgi:hypothetical protein
VSPGFVGFEQIGYQNPVDGHAAEIGMSYGRIVEIRVFEYGA